MAFEPKIDRIETDGSRTAMRMMSNDALDMRLRVAAHAGYRAGYAAASKIALDCIDAGRQDGALINRIVESLNGPPPGDARRDRPIRVVGAIIDMIGAAARMALSAGPARDVDYNAIVGATPTPCPSAQVPPRGQIGQ